MGVLELGTILFMPVNTLFTRFLDALGVPHTTDWSNKAFEGMTFKSLYGLSHLLTEYGIPNKALRISQKSDIFQLSAPFLAQMSNGAFVIVTSVEKDQVKYESRGEHLNISLTDFLDAWNGIVLLAFPSPGSAEPDYFSHHLTDLIRKAGVWLLCLSGAVIFLYLFISRQLYASAACVLLVIFDCIGLYFSWLLMQKSLHIHTAASDRVCGVLEQGGCDTIMDMKVSKLFGVFSWSEVGFGYFLISLGCLLIFPELAPSLALCNICCLPYTFWSIWYQRFRAHHWCTLCVGVQSTLWLLFFSYLFGGFVKNALPIQPEIFILLCSYLFMVLFLNQLVTVIKKLPCNEKDS